MSLKQITYSIIKEKPKMKPLKILLIDPCYLNTFTRHVIYTPLNIGYIGAYTKALFGNSVDIAIHKDHRQFLDAVQSFRPHLVGFSFYVWNTDLTKTLISIVREKMGNEAIIVAGGPSVDIDSKVQLSIFDLLPGVDALIPDDGEIGFSNLVSILLGGGKALQCVPIDGVVFRNGSSLVVGESVGNFLDLSTLPSPYLTGLLDEFLTTPYRPLIQTNRGCPYTCRFCVAGRSNEKMRQFPLEQVKEEITFISKKYSGEDNLPLFIADLNFGMFKQDIEISRHLREMSRSYNFPTDVGIYTDKRFSSKTRAMMEELGELNGQGIAIAFQSENEESLQSVKRTNLPEQEIVDAIEWARARKIQITAVYIFGMPNETREAFVEMLKRGYARKFDNIKMVSLLLFDGNELNRSEVRKQHEFTTKYRVHDSNYMEVDGHFVAETSEVVVSSSTFSFDDFLYTRSLGFIFFAIGHPGFYKLFFRGLEGVGVDTFVFLSNFLSPSSDYTWPKGYLDFLSDLNTAFRSELYDSVDAVKESMKKDYLRDGRQVRSGTKINNLFTSRLMFIEQYWHNEVLTKHLEILGITPAKHDEWLAVKDLMAISAKERLNPRYPHNPGKLTVQHDILSWISENFCIPLQQYALSQPIDLSFIMPDHTMSRLSSFNKTNGHLSDTNYYYNALTALQPQKITRCPFSYETVTV